MKHSSTLYEGGRMKIRIEISLSVWLWGLVAHASPEVPKTPEATGDMLQGDPVAPGIYEGDVRELSPAPRWKKGQPIREVPKRVYPRPEPVPPPQPSPADPLWERQSRTDADKPPRAITPPDLNIAGIGFTGAFPPDTVGDVGPDHSSRWSTTTAVRVCAYSTSPAPASPVSSSTLWRRQVLVRARTVLGIPWCSSIRLPTDGC
jgi:hypothetical protein